MGYHDGPGHPEGQTALADARKKITEKGILAAGLAIRPVEADQFIASGMRLIGIGGFDAILIPQAIKGLLDQLDR